jgi:virginiamycin A acetyltransferase
MMILGIIRAALSEVVLNLSVKLNPFSRYRKRPPMSRRIRYLKDVVKRDDVEIGEYSYGGVTIHSWGRAKLRIGKFCAFANCVIELRGNHPMNHVSTYAFPAFVDDWPVTDPLKRVDVEWVNKRDVVIGNDVWIGNGATILAGVTIGDGAVVGTCSVVAADVAPYAIVAGNPARLIRKRFDDETIRRLLEIRWWDWPHDKIAANMHIISSDNVAKLFELSER